MSVEKRAKMPGAGDSQWAIAGCDLLLGVVISAILRVRGTLSPKHPSPPTPGHSRPVICKGFYRSFLRRQSVTPF